MNSRRVPLFVLTAIALATPPVLAQSSSQGVPSREGNRWGGLEHEPNPAAVPQGPRAQQQRETDELEQINRQLQQKVQQDIKSGGSSMGGGGGAGGGGGGQ